MIPAPSTRFVSVLALALAFIAPLVRASEPAPGSLLPGGPGAWRLSWSDEFDYPEARFDEIWESQNQANGHILSSRWRENV